MIKQKQIYLLTGVSMLLFLCISCQVKSSQAPMKLDITSEKEVKSVMLYDTI